ncbi:expressed unknown protein [Seminavis robusta]|uniref:Uncharacterized protein n=1 Tax=Seminavis robusta TaxID=568900 RepID=A0A9N8E0Y5_9STRA|nr:expressed unknown protein [Seminavis robusta]|eukprot:Sro451_g354171.1  (116) ;mRNA; r:3267-3614
MDIPAFIVIPTIVPNKYDEGNTSISSFSKPNTRWHSESPSNRDEIPRSPPRPASLPDYCLCHGLPYNPRRCTPKISSVAALRAPRYPVRRSDSHAPRYPMRQVTRRSLLSSSLSQ